MTDHNYDDYGEFWKMCEYCGKPWYLGINWPHTDCENATVVGTPEQKTRRIFDRISGRLRGKVYSRDGARCQVCGSTENLTLDHIIPIARGGTNDESNLQVLCHSCNCRKGAR